MKGSVRAGSEAAIATTAAMIGPMALRCGCAGVRVCGIHVSHCHSRVVPKHIFLRATALEVGLTLASTLYFGSSIRGVELQKHPVVLSQSVEVLSFIRYQSEIDESA